jgi:nitroreductase/FMN reductase [NAD(P)H]
MVDASKLYEDRYGKSSILDFSNINIPDLLKTIISRSSVRKFSDKPIPKELLTILLTAAQSAPSKSNLQQYSILIMQDEVTKKKVADLIGNTKWALSAPVFLLFLADIRRNINVTNNKGYDHKNNNVDTFMNAVIDSALSMQSLICAAEASGLGVCPISMIRNIIDEIKNICQLPKGVFPIAGLALGWPDEKAPISIRMPQDIIIHNDYYNEDTLTKKINDYDKRVFKVAPILEKKQRHVDIYGVAKKGTWSENIARQLSLPERNNFKAWLKDNGINLE